MPGTPLQVSKSGDSLALSWDSTQCPAAEVNVYYGTIGDYSGFTGGHCARAPTGSTTLDMPVNTWFLVTSTDGVDTDGSWSRDHTGAELSYAGAGAACPSISQHVSGGTCQGR